MTSSTTPASGGSTDVRSLKGEDSGPGSRGHRSSLFAGAGSVVSGASLLFIWAAMIVFFGIMRPDTFLTFATLRTVMGDQAITAIMALALVMPIAADQFDLSISGTMGLAVILAGTFMAKLGIAPGPAMALILVAGVLVGIVNALVVVGLRVNSFIATLGAGAILVALQEWVSHNQVISSGVPQSFKELGRTTVFTIPIPFFYMLVLAALLWYVLEYRQLGRYLYAIGSNGDAARLAGVRTKRIIATSLVVSAAIAAIAGIIFMMRIGSTSGDAGAPYLLPAFAAAFLGATQFKNGRVNVPGTVVAIYVLATGVKGVQLMGAPLWVEGLFNGCALIVAVALAVRSGRQRALA